MSDAEQLKLEKLVEIHRAHSEWQGHLLVSYLGENGVEAVLRLPAGDPLLEALEIASGPDKACGVFVLEHDVDRASGLVKEFLSQPIEESLLEQAASPDDSAAGEEKI